MFSYLFWSSCGLYTKFVELILRSTLQAASSRTFYQQWLAKEKTSPKRKYSGHKTLKAERVAGVLQFLSNSRFVNDRSTETTTFWSMLLIVMHKGIWTPGEKDWFPLKHSLETRGWLCIRWRMAASHRQALMKPQKVPNVFSIPSNTSNTYGI